MSNDVAIVGAGELGGSLAHVLARRQIVRRIVLIDPAGQVAAGKALDIMQAGPVERFCTTVAGSTDISRIAGSCVVILADFVAPESGQDPLLVLRQVAALARRAFVICAGTHGRELVERAVRELHIPREQIVGSAPEALASAVRAMVALAVDGSAREVSLAVFGVPPARTVVPWEDVTIGGIPATRVLDEPTRRRLAAQTGPLWPPGPHALAHAAADVVAAVRGVSRRTLSCFVAPDDSTGVRARATAVPVRLNEAGILSVEPSTLSVAARVALDNAALL